MNNIQLSGAALAVGAAALLCVTPTFADDTTAAPMVHCQSGNACKGKDVVDMSQEDCDKAGGKVIE
jgi:hypothetical protein